MRENENLISVLNQILVDELKVVDNNILYSKENDNLEFEKIEKETTAELKQAEWLVHRIIFLEFCRTHRHLLNVNQNNADDNYEKRSRVG